MEKGENWFNNKLYDFTSVIHAETWSENLYRKVTLSASDIVDIQTSNSNNKANSPYLELCDRIESSAQDTITQAICRAIK